MKVGTPRFPGRFRSCAQLGIDLKNKAASAGGLGDRASDAAYPFFFTVGPRVVVSASSADPEVRQRVLLDPFGVNARVP